MIKPGDIMFVNRFNTSGYTSEKAIEGNPDTPVILPKGLIMFVIGRGFEQNETGPAGYWVVANAREVFVYATYVRTQRPVDWPG